VIVGEASRRFKIFASKEDTIPGYLLSALVYKIGLEYDFKIKSFLKNKKFFVQENVIPR
jgi:hypothetical protein